MSVREQAQTFDTVTLNTIAAHAEHQSALLRNLEPKPWRRTTQQKDAIDTFDQLAAYARRVINMQKDQ